MRELDPSVSSVAWHAPSEGLGFKTTNSKMHLKAGTDLDLDQRPVFLLRVAPEAQNFPWECKANLHPDSQASSPEDNLPHREDLSSRV